MAKTTNNDLIGKVLHDTHRITRLIGYGGMGEVYEAVHVRLSKKRVAIKVLRDRMIGAQGIYARFRREAEIATDLGHPNIVEVQDFYDTDDGRPCIVMELLEGESLHALLERCGGLPPTRMCEIASQVGRALQTAHDNGIVHRDLKPANIFICDRSADKPEVVKLVDFGISKIRDSNTQLTGNRDVLGTPHYMSPEQGRGEVSDVDHTTDIFAMGIICYRALCGKLPFDAPTLPGVIYRVCFEDPVPASSLRAGLTRAVDDVLLRAMAKTKDKRYQRVLDFVDDLRGALASVVMLQTAPTGQLLLADVPVDPGKVEEESPGTAQKTDREVFEQAATISTGETGEEGQQEAPAAVAAAGASLERQQNRDGAGRSAEAAVTGFGEQTTISGSVGETLSRAERVAAVPSAENRRLAWAGGVLALASALVVVFYVWQDRDGEALAPWPVLPGTGEATVGSARPPARPDANGRTVASQPAASPDARPGEAAVTEVRVTLKLSPAWATVLVDGKVRQDNPLVLGVSTRSHSLRVEARGYRPHGQVLLADVTRELKVSLKKTRPRRRGQPPITKTATGDIKTRGPATNENAPKTKKSGQEVDRRRTTPELKAPATPGEKKARPREGFRDL